MSQISPETETLFQIFETAYWVEWKVHHGTEPGQARRAGVAALLNHLSAGHAQTPAELGMQGAVQYRRKDGGYGPRWITMAVFDGTLAAESYCNLQRKDDKWPFEYRAIELPAMADTSTDRPAARFLCLCCEEVEVKKDGDECEFCRITYSVTSPTGNSK